MEQITMVEALKDMKIEKLQEEIRKLKEENLNLKSIIMYQSYEKVGIKPKSMQLKKDI